MNDKTYDRQFQMMSFMTRPTHVVFPATRIVLWIFADLCDCELVFLKLVFGNLLVAVFLLQTQETIIRLTYRSVSLDWQIANLDGIMLRTKTPFSTEDFIRFCSY